MTTIELSHIWFVGSAPGELLLPSTYASHVMLQRGNAPRARNLDTDCLFSKPGPSNDFELKARTQKVRTGETQFRKLRHQYCSGLSSRSLNFNQVYKLRIVLLSILGIVLCNAKNCLIDKNYNLVSPEKSSI